jgi:hypothetical protein
MTRIYIVGFEGRLKTHETAPRRWNGTDSKGKAWTRYGWPNSSSAHVNEKGFLSEGRTAYGDRIFARVMPEDAVESLAELDAQIVEAEKTWQRLRQERQELLAAAAVRGQRVRVKDVLPIEPLIPKTERRGEP